MKSNLFSILLKDIFFKQWPKVALSQVIMWGVSTHIQNPTLVDVAWGVNHFIIGTSILTNNFTSLTQIFASRKSMMNFALLSIWFLRLSGFILYNRVMKHHVDPRYKSLAAKQKINEKIYYFFQFQLQGVLSAITALPLYFLFRQQSQTFEWNNYLGMGLSVVGIVGEAIADKQLQAFKESNPEKGSTFREGLFKKSRHPNLFFELMFWSGMALNAVDFSKIQETGWAILGPIALYFIMNYVTIPITTEHMKKTRPNYEEVIKKTNKFWPFQSHHSEEVIFQYQLSNQDSQQSLYKFSFRVTLSFSLQINLKFLLSISRLMQISI